jgi:hypothetical protein
MPNLADATSALASVRAMWDIPIMVTTKADSRRRVVVPQVKPGQVYAIQDAPDGSIRLTLLKEPEPVDRPAKVTFVKEGRFTVGVTDRPINMKALKEALAEFP